MIKASIGKLECEFNPVEEAEAAGFEMLPFTGGDALPLKELPMHHKDPFDRMLIAQSLARDVPVMTCDSWFAKYDAPLIK